MGGADLTIKIGNGDGTFGANSTYENGTGIVRGIVSADFDGDGYDDVAHSSQTDNVIQVFRGNGDGTLMAAVSFQTGAAPWDLDTADLNGDGILDLVSSDRNSGELSILYGNGDATFQARVTIAGPSETTLVEDFNNDGYLDLLTTSVFANPRGELKLNDGYGNFTATLSFPGPSYYSSVAGDFNNDGNVDFATANALTSDTTVYLGNGDGSFHDGVNFSTNGIPRDIDSADLNGDGFDDLVLASSDTTSASILISNGDGTFNAYSTLSYSNNVKSILLTDINSDGVNDLIIGQGSIAVFTGNQGRINTQESLDLLSQSSAREELSVLKSRLSAVNLERANIGAIQSRFEVAIESLTNSVNTFTNASSRIMDADIAQESSQLVRLQLLQQAGAAVLAQANTQPAIANSLLT